MCYAKLNCDASLVTVTKSVSEKVGAVINGKQSYLWKTNTKKIAEFHPGYIPDHIEGLSDEEYEEVKAWTKKQLLLINAAYTKLASEEMFGGLPVIKKNANDDKKYRSWPGYIKNCKVGEFIGVIDRAYSCEDKNNSIEELFFERFKNNLLPTSHLRAINKLMHANESESSSIETSGFVRKLKEEGRLSELLDSVVSELGQIIIDSDNFANEAFSEKEMHDLYVAERQLFYFLTAGAMKQSALEEAAKRAAVEKFNNFKATRQGYVIGKVKHVSKLMREFNSSNKS